MGRPGCCNGAVLCTRRSIFLLPFILLALCTAVYGAAPDTTVRAPRLLFAQRNHILYLRIVCPQATLRPSLRLNDSTLEFKAFAAVPEAGAPGRFEATIHFYRRLESQLATWSVKDREVILTVPKKWSGKYWPRVLRDPKDRLKSYVGTDWQRWKEETEEMRKKDENISDEEIEAEEAAVSKPASFPEEEYDDSNLLLLTNESALVNFLDSSDVASILFIDRAKPESRALHRAFAMIAPLVQSRVPVAVLDGKENADLAKRLQVSMFPASKLFFKSGEMFSYNAKELGYTTVLVRFLLRQLEPAYEVLETEEDALAFINSKRKAVLGYFPSMPREEKVFIAMAKRFRADLDPKMAGIYALLSPEAASIFATDGRFRTLPSNFSGTVFVKADEPLGVYSGSYKWKPLHSWVYQYQFDRVEEITRWNFKEFRRRNLPILYTILDDKPETHMGILQEVQQVATAFYSNISFVYTYVNETGDLLEHLRCEYRGFSYAVLEDFIEDYRYCVETEGPGGLSASRIKKLCEGFLTREVDADHVQSEQLPGEEIGPVFTVVADNLLRQAMDPSKDVLLHFYASFDEKWEYSEHVLEKVAEEFEDVPTLFVGKMDGIKNERPKQFPDIGYFPCTWLFPAKEKMRPILFNASAGLTEQRLKDFLYDHVSFPLKTPDQLGRGIGSLGSALGKDEL